MKKMSVQQGPEEAQAFYQKMGQSLWVHINGKTLCVDLKPQSQRRSKSKGGASNPEIKATMPGKIIAIKKKVGDAVSVGETIIIMEAMKMEYSLKAQVPGVLQSLSCSENQQVTLGQELAFIKKEDS